MTATFFRETAMRRIALFIATNLAVLLLLPAYSSAQSLGEVAAKEREKRKNAKPAKVYTERDLRGAGAGAPVNVGSEVATGGDAATQAAGGTTAAAGGAPGAKKEKTEDEIREDQQKAWRESLAKAQGEVTRLTNELAPLEAVAGDVRSAAYGANREMLMNRINDLKAKIAAAQQQVETLTEQGRRQGYR